MFLFIGKDIQVFLVFRISAFCSWSCWTGVTHKISIFFHQGTFLLDPELPNVSKFSRDVPTLLHQKLKWSATNFWNWHFPLWDGMLVKRCRSKDLLGFLLREGICHVNLDKNPQILRLKHKLAALQRSAEELFVCCYGIEQSMHLFLLWCDFSPHCQYFSRRKCKPLCDI